jgi:parallel beta-helix repeat protein
MTTYYVRKTGNDSTGDGSTGSPWLTINKAITTVSLAGGHTILVGAGEYAETSGSGYLNFARTFLNWVEIAPESGLQDVIIHGDGTGNRSIVLNETSQYIKFTNIDFSLAYVANYAIFMLGNTNYININHCKIPVGTGNTVTASAIYANSNSYNGINDITIDSNVITGTNAVGSGINLATTTQRAMARIAITNNLITTSTYYGIIVGQDTANASLKTITNLTITGNSINIVGSHALILGCGVVSGNVANNNISGGQYGIILKENTGCTVTGNYAVGGSMSSLLFKGANNSTVSNNKFLNTTALGHVIGVRIGETGSKSSGNSFTNNICVSGNPADLFSWDADGDNGSNVCDYNTYKAQTWGAILGTTITSLATLRAAWSEYGDGSNDSHSRLYSVGGSMIGRGAMRLII